MMRRISLWILGTLLVGSGFDLAQADDWPKWLGARGDGIWRETGILETLPPAGPPVKWRMPIGPGYTGPSVANGRVFVMDRTKATDRTEEEINELKKKGILAGGERIVCLDQNSGNVIWEREYKCDYAKISYPSGPRCTPTVDGDFVYTLGTMGDLKCLKIADGSIVWEKRFSDQYARAPEKEGDEPTPVRPPVWGYASHPMIDGPRLIVPVGGAGSAVVAFDKMTGKELWKNLTSSDIAYAPLVIFGEGDQRQLLFWHADGVDSLKPETGEHFWNHKFPETQTQPGMTTSIMTPQIIGDLFYISEFFSGSLLLRIQSNPPGVEELFRSTGEDPRHEHSLNTLIATPVVRNGLVYGVTGEGTFRCNRLDNGKMIWENPTFMSEKPQLFATNFIVENEGRFFSLDDHGTLSILELNDQGYKATSSCPLIEATENARGRTVVWSHPAFANKCIFARNNKEIVCFDMAKPN